MIKRIAAVGFLTVSGEHHYLAEGVFSLFTITPMYMVFNYHLQAHEVMEGDIVTWYKRMDSFSPWVEIGKGSFLSAREMNQQPIGGMPAEIKATIQTGATIIERFINLEFMLYNTNPLPGREYEFLGGIDFKITYYDPNNPLLFGEDEFTYDANNREPLKLLNEGDLDSGFWYLNPSLCNVKKKYVKQPYVCK